MSSEFITTITNLIYTAFAVISFIVSIILFICFFSRAMEYEGPALTLAIINLIIGASRFLPGVFNWKWIEDIMKNQDSYNYLTMVVLGVPYDVIKIITFTATGMILFKRVGVSPFKLKERLKNKGYWFNILISVLLFTGFTEILIYITKPELTEGGKFFYEMMTGLYTTETIASFHIAASAPFIEEISYRFFWPALILNSVKNKNLSWPLAIIIPSILWSFGHIGLLEPWWMRFVQISFYGIILGLLFKKEGIEACIISHLISNIILTAIHLNTNF